MKNLYQNSQSKVKSRERESRWFEVKTGVRQGGVLSPLLFIIFMDKCMREICKNSNSVKTMAYADDIAVITDNQIQLQEELNSWQEEWV